MGEIYLNHSLGQEAANISWLKTSNENFSIASFLYIILVNVLAISGNIALLLVILRSHKLRTNLTYVFVLNLCIIDILASTTVLPIAAVGIFNGFWQFSHSFCVVSGILSTFCALSSILAICAISVERFYVIKLPMEYALRMTSQRALMVLSYVWIQSVLLASLPAVGWNLFVFQPGMGHCSFSLHVEGIHGLYVMVVFFFGFVVPGMVMLFMYYGIYKVAHTVAVRVQPMPATLMTSRCLASGSYHYNGRHSPLEDSFHRPSSSCSTRFEQLRSPTPTYRGNSPTTCEQHLFYQREDLGGSMLSTPRTTDSSPSTDSSMRTGMPAPPAPRLAIAEITPQVSIETPSSDQSPNNTTASFGPAAPPGSPSKAIKTLLLIMMAHMALWGPYFIVTVSDVIRGDAASNVTSLTVVTWMAYTSFAVNPVVYGWMNRAVREEMFSCLQDCLHICMADNDQEEPEVYGPAENFYEFLERTSTSHTCSHPNTLSDSRRASFEQLGTGTGGSDTNRHADMKF